MTTSEARRALQPSRPVPLPRPGLVSRAWGMRLRPWRATPLDVAALVTAWRDPDIVAANCTPADVSADRASRWIAGEAERRSRGIALDLVIGPLGGDAVWGEVGLRGVDSVARRAEVGWWLAPERRGRGVAAAAVDLLVTWALAPPLDLLQVWARIDPANEASTRVAARARLRLLGTADGSAVWARARRSL